MLRVISRPITVPAERIALLKAALSITCSSTPGPAFSTGAGMGGSSKSPVTMGGRSIDTAPVSDADGAILAAPFAGRTYYYQSDCYLELARRTADGAWCAKVRERKTLLGDGSSHTPASCQRMVAVLQASRARTQHSADRHAAAVQGVFKIESAQVTALPTGDWLLAVQAAGSLPGRYCLQVDNSRDRSRLVTQELTLPQPGPLRYTLVRKQVLGTTALPNIFPIAVSLTYLFPADSAYASQEQVKEHLSSIQNLTLSAQ